MMIDVSDLSRTTTNKMSLSVIYSERDRSNVSPINGSSSNHPFYYQRTSDVMELGGTWLEVKVKKET